MKNENRINSKNTAWENALKKQLERPHCLCGKLLNMCDKAFSHMTQGY